MNLAESSRGPVVVTGAAGFIGRAVVSALRRRGREVRAVVRGPTRFADRDVHVFPVGDLADAPVLGPALDGAGAIIHLAARAHVIDKEPEASLERFIRSNIVATEKLARAAAAAGAQRFVFASSVSVYGSVKPDDYVVREDAPLAPDRPYGVSKAQAEERLLTLSDELGISVVRLRPPAVYGPNAPGHFARLMKAARLGLPLPIGSVRNCRSFIYVENLADAFAVAAESQAEGAYNVTDSDPISTANLYVRLGHSMGRPVAAWPCPRAVVKGLARVALGRLRAESLLGSMAVDGSGFADAFGWSPAISMDEAIDRTTSGGH